MKRNQATQQNEAYDVGRCKVKADNLSPDTLYAVTCMQCEWSMYVNARDYPLIRTAADSFARDHTREHEVDEEWNSRK